MFHFLPIGVWRQTIPTLALDSMYDEDEWPASLSLSFASNEISDTCDRLTVCEHDADYEGSSARPAVLTCMGFMCAHGNTYDAASCEFTPLFPGGAAGNR